jgi:hypothetical protein
MFFPQALCESLLVGIFAEPVRRVYEGRFLEEIRRQPNLEFILERRSIFIEINLYQKIRVFL